MTALVTVFLVLTLGWVLTVLVRAGVDGHHRGRARVMAGTSWSPKGERLDAGLIFPPEPNYCDESR